MGGNTYGQHDGSPRSCILCQRDEMLNCLSVPGNDNLPRRIEINSLGNTNLRGAIANPLNCLIIKTENRSHGAFVFRNGILHEFGSDIDH